MKDEEGMMKNETFLTMTLSVIRKMNRRYCQTRYEKRRLNEKAFTFGLENSTGFDNTRTATQEGG